MRFRAATDNGCVSFPNPVSSVHDRLRHRAASELRSRTAGDDPVGRARSIWGTPGERWFTADDPIWRVHANASMFLGGVRALLLQALHPVAMAGVAQNSTYREDPWGRLQQISGFISMTTYGSVADAERLMARVSKVHTRISGVAPNGRAYRADDPDLLLWVHCAEIDSFLDAYRRFGAATLSDADADLYVAQTARAAGGIGVPTPPGSVAELRAVLASYRPVLDAGPDALDVLEYLKHPHGLDGPGRLGYAALYRGAVASLPGYALELFGLRFSSARRAVDLRAGDAGVRGIRWMLNDPLVAGDRLTHDQLTSVGPA